MGCSEVIRLLVRWALRNEHHKIAAAYLYYVENRSISEIAHELGKPRTTVRGWVLRVAQRNGGGSTSYRGLSRLLREVYPIVFSLPPALRKPTPELIEAKAREVIKLWCGFTTRA